VTHHAPAKHLAWEKFSVCGFFLRFLRRIEKGKRETENRSPGKQESNLRYTGEIDRAIRSNFWYEFFANEGIVGCFLPNPEGITIPRSSSKKNDKIDF